MLTVEEWRRRAQFWRVMTESEDDPLLRQQLRVLAEDADAVAAEMEKERERRRRCSY